MLDMGTKTGNVLTTILGAMTLWQVVAVIVAFNSER